VSSSVHRRICIVNTDSAGTCQTHTVVCWPV